MDFLVLFGFVEIDQLTCLRRDAVIAMFGGVESFKREHAAYLANEMDDEFG